MLPKTTNLGLTGSTPCFCGLSDETLKILSQYDRCVSGIFTLEFTYLLETYQLQHLIFTEAMLLYSLNGS